MSNHHPAPPTPRQQSYIRRLALQRGVSFTPPKTFAEADATIRSLQRRKPDTAADRRREIKTVRRDMMNNRGGAARVRENEVQGYGSSATWKGAQS